MHASFEWKHHEKIRLEIEELRDGPLFRRETAN
jgi:hypothetical protein